ncbi:GntR family transcriptional regulator, partial [Streptomyces sp. ND04-05B]|nr:GntR family transcriptional regulator [Streptomyces sp. ND04-05B]
MDDTPAIEAALPAQVPAAAPSGVAGPDGRRDYRPGYEIVAERILTYIAEERLAPGDRLPTEIDLART